LNKTSGVGALLGAAVCVVSATASAATPEQGASPEPDDEIEVVKESHFAPALASAPGPGIGLEGYAGIGLVMGAGGSKGRGLVGGLLRLRYQYFQLGGSVEVSDSGQSDSLLEEEEESWRAFQAFVGVWLPFDRWINIDASIGYADRRYLNADRIYGPDGMNVGGAALAFRFGISDRLGHKLVGTRIGAALLGTVDLNSLSAPYERTYLDEAGEVRSIEGTTNGGGVSLMLAIAAGFELGGRAPFNPND